MTGIHISLIFHICITDGHGSWQFIYCPNRCLVFPSPTREQCQKQCQEEAEQVSQGDALSGLPLEEAGPGSVKHLFDWSANWHEPLNWQFVPIALHFIWTSGRLLCLQWNNQLKYCRFSWTRFQHFQDWNPCLITVITKLVECSHLEGSTLTLQHSSFSLVQYTWRATEEMIKGTV